MTQVKKLIEVAMPIKEISAESVRDKSIRHGHISTLHLWWARRPLPVCRAVVFASLVPDPLDENCPQAFKDAVEILLGKANNPGDPYKPYDDIPYTAAVDKMEDNLRNRLLMFIGKFSEIYIANERIGKKTEAKDQLSDGSLIKWDNKDNAKILSIARRLIFVSYNATGKDADSLLRKYDKLFNAIKLSENELFNTIDRHENSTGNFIKKENLNNAINEFLKFMPVTFDPFTGGGAIPLESARLGCRSFGNDINPVAHIIQKGSNEFPQKFGKPIIYSKEKFIEKYGKEVFINTPNEFKVIEGGTVVGIRILNRLSFDVNYYANRLLNNVERSIGQFYPSDAKGKRPIAYYWARVGICSNPSCKAEVPLLRQFYLANTKSRQIYLNPIIRNNNIEFEIKHGIYELEGWISRGNLKCPCCNNITDVKTLKQQSLLNHNKERLLAVIWEGKIGKEYKLPEKTEIDTLKLLPEGIERPSEPMPVEYTQALPSCTWGLEEWGQMFTDRQILLMLTIVKELNDFKNSYKLDEKDYKEAIITYLGIWVDRIAARSTSFGLWHSGRETLEYPFGRQAIPMIFDFPESMPFEKGSGSPLNQLEWIIRYIESEGNSSFWSELKHASSGDKLQFQEKSITSVITDPPYYDAIGYADISDFFYIWLKRTLGDVFPMNFATPLTPKSEECTAIKHHHGGDMIKAKKHFESKLTQIFKTLESQTSDIVCIMFAHQSTEAWTTLCNSILGAKMNITGSWASDSEYSESGLKANKSFLSSSVTVTAKPFTYIGIGTYKEVRREIEKKVAQEVEDLYKLGLRGADLLTACFGKAVSVFGQYENVEKADGSAVTVAELLDMAKESAFNALLKGFDGDDFTKFYIGWLQLYGFTESDFDDAAKFSRVGLNINVSDLFQHNLFIKNGNKQELAGYIDRLEANSKIGEGGYNFIIDYVHRAMALYSGTNRKDLLSYIGKVASSPDSSFWRVITSLCEILPQGSDDYKQAAGLLLNKESLLRESKTIQQTKDTQGELF